MTRFPPLEERRPRAVQTGLFWLLSGLAALAFLLWAPPAEAVTGNLERATSRALVVNGRTLQVSQATRMLPPDHPLGSQNLYQLTEAEIRSLPAYKSRRLRTVVKVRVRERQGMALVVQPLEIVQ